jgi:hypothetical protein
MYVLVDLMWFPAHQLTFISQTHYIKMLRYFTIQTPPENKESVRTEVIID